MDFCLRNDCKWIRREKTFEELKLFLLTQMPVFIVFIVFIKGTETQVFFFFSKCTKLILFFFYSLRQLYVKLIHLLYRVTILIINYSMEKKVCEKIFERLLRSKSFNIITLKLKLFKLLSTLFPLNQI